jgi:hypothetical protein
MTEDVDKIDFKIMIYKFRRDWKVILVSALAVVAILIVLCVAWFVEGDVEALIAMPLWLLLMAGVILRTPRYFYIEKNLIIVKFFLGSKVLEGIRSVRPIGKAELKRCARTFGNGGLMGYTGHFRSKELGDFQMLAVRKDELALVTLDSGKQYVINYPRELLDKSKAQ